MLIGTLVFMAGLFALAGLASFWGWRLNQPPKGGSPEITQPSAARAQHPAEPPAPQA